MDCSAHLLPCAFVTVTSRDTHFKLPADKPLTLAAYAAGPVTTAYVDPVAVGDVMPDMPLFLEPERHVLTPLEATYQAAWGELPEGLLA